MATPAEIIDMVASLQNDTVQDVYTDEACLPYLNMALDEFSEILEDNNIGVTNETSAIKTVPAGITAITKTSTPYELPANLVEIQQLWESATGLQQWTPMTRKEFLPLYLTTTPINQFIIWTWQQEQIQFPAANAINDIKIDYVARLFTTPLTIADIGSDLNVLNCKLFLGYRTASLCSMFIGENETRAGALNEQAQEAIARALSIGNKGKQAIQTRRRPFRSAFKRFQTW